MPATDFEQEDNQKKRTIDMDDRHNTPPLKEGPEAISSEELLNGRAEIQIQHEGEIYRLRRTSKGKLIMTK